MPSSHILHQSSNLDHCDIQSWPEEDWDVHHWRAQVAQATRTRTPPTRPATTRSRRPPTRSHRPISRSCLVEIAHNQRSNPRTSPNTKATRRPKSRMPPKRPENGPNDEYSPTSNNQPSQVSRPSRRNQGQKSLQQTIQPSYRSSPTLPGPSTNPPSSKNSKPSSQHSSKGKKNTFAQAPSVTSITLQDLEQCNPPVKLRSYTAVILEYNSLPPAAADLYEKLQSVPHALIPPTLKPAYDVDTSTPRKSQPPVRDREYMRLDEVPYPAAVLPHLKARVDRVVKAAAWNHKQEVHERQWGALANSIFEEFALWPSYQGLRILNTETCTIAPSELHTRLFEQKLQYPTDTNSNVDRDEDDNHEGKDGRGKKSEVTISKMVDWCLGLELSPQEDSLVSAAWRQINYWNEHSLNQSLSFIKKTPLFADVEIKKTQQSSNPEIQLAIWGSGADQKRKHHGWDTSMPMPGITIEGHTWRYYLFTKIGPDLVMLGPFEMGTTATLLGVWRIIWHLDALIRWGLTDYRQWFNDNIMAWASGLVNSSTGSTGKAKELEGQTAKLEINENS